MTGPPKVKATNMKIRINFRNFTFAAMKWLAESYYDSNQHLTLARCMLQRFHTVLETRGKAEAIRFCKERRATLYQWLASIDTIEAEPRSSSKVCLPNGLKSLRYVKKLDYPEIRLILTALYASRGIELPVSPNIDAIVGPPIGKGLSDIGKYVPDFWEAIGIRKHLDQNPRSVRWRKFHLSTKQGPNGHALWSAVADLSVLPDSLKESIKFLGGDRLSFRMSTLEKYIVFFYPFFRVVGRKYRKISAIPSHEGKTREVAILDYWSQTCLRGLNQYLFKCLRRIPQDCTFNQGSFLDKLSWEDGEPFYSVDLTAATDRFPIDLISLVLRARFSDDYVNHWRNIMVGYPFVTSGYGEIRYSVGNPMGAYSSWNSFALSHHYVMYYCCRELGLDWRKAAYVILGDDVVIKHQRLAEKYIEVLTHLGLTFSASKTHVSRHMFEFAKRVFHNGVEITPFPLSALWKTKSSPSLMLNVLVSEERKGWLSPIGSPAALSELYAHFRFNSTYRAKIRKMLCITYQFMVAFSGRKPAQEALQQLVVDYYPDLKANANLGVLAFTRSVDLSFRKSSDPNKGGEPLGLIAERLVILITGDDNAAIDAFDLIQSLPVLQVHGQIEELYLKIMKSPHTAVQNLMKGDWKTALRALAIPISDRVYYSRNQDIMVQACFSLAKIWVLEMNKEQIAHEKYMKPFASIFSNAGISDLFASFGAPNPLSGVER
jgi:hypothetical protein